MKRDTTVQWSVVYRRDEPWTIEPTPEQLYSVGTADGKFCAPSDTDCANAPQGVVGELYVHRFDVAGTYPYFCAPHAIMGMTGTVIVTPLAGQCSRT